MSDLKKKLFIVFVALSAAIVIAGIVLYCLLGFNRSAERPESYTVEVSYDVIVDLADGGAAIEKACEDSFAAQGLKYLSKTKSPMLDEDSLVENSDHLLTYTFASAPREKLAAAADAVRAAIASSGSAENAAYDGTNVSVSVHSLAQERFYDAAWRGAVALATGAVAALIYLGIRYGLSAAAAGCALTLDSVFCTLGLYAIARIPVYAYAPLVAASVAAMASALLWMLVCIKYRACFKSPEYAGLPVLDVTARAEREALPWVLSAGGALAAIVAIVGAVAADGVMLFVLPLLIPVAVSVAGTLFFAPFVYAPVKKALARRARKKGGYVGKKKAENKE